MINSEECSTLIPPSLFWADLAKHIIQSNSSDFLSDSFWSFNSKREFVLGCSVLPSGEADYEIVNSKEKYLISSKSSFLIFAREVKALPFNKSQSLVINQRFFDPNEKYTFE